MQEMVLVEDGPDLDFEEVYQRLEEIVGRLESGGLTLEESIDLYESGMRLAHRCKQMLDAAELRVSELQREFATESAEQGADEELDEEPE
jgi:exodeoxyribonuclease VII small subunit